MTGTQTSSPYQTLVPHKLPLQDDIPFGEARKLAIEVPVDPRGQSDVYIDDIFALAVDVPGSNNTQRLESAPLLAIHDAARPKHETEPIPREEMPALNKLAAEAGLEEIKTILGWLFDFRRLLVALPENKYVAWKREIRRLIDSKTTSAKELERLVGRMTHLSVIVPSVHHFLSRLRDLQTRAKSRRSIKIDSRCLDDLELMSFFLDKAYSGIDMNIIAYLLPTFCYRSDSCPRGLGGYSHEGWAWRWYLPEDLQFRASNNLLEHLAAIITPWIDLLHGRLKRGDCILSMTDSTTSEGWARKTNFSELGEDPIEATIRIEVARKHATNLLNAEVKDYSQWFPGAQNQVADALSRDDDRTDEELTRILRTYCPEQVPEHFEIVPLPNEIASWVTSLLLRLPRKMQLQEQHTRTKLGRGEDGNSGATKSGSEMTSSLIPLHPTKGSDYSDLSPWVSVKDDFRQNLMTHWLKAQSEVPSHTWYRPSGRMIGQTPPRTKTESLVDFYRDYSDLSKAKTQRKNNRKLCQLSPSANSPKCTSLKRKLPSEN